MSEQKKNIGVRLTERQLEMIDQIKKELGLAYRSETLIRGLELLYKTQFPHYRKSKPHTYGEGGKLTPQEKARQKYEYEAEKKKAEQDAKDAEKEKVCVGHLEGEVVEINGQKFCEYTQHLLHQDAPARRPLDVISTDIPVWIPSKEMVLKRRPDAKKVKPK